MYICLNLIVVLALACGGDPMSQGKAEEQDRARKLIEQLKDSDRDKREKAAIALSEMGAKAKDALMPLHEAIFRETDPVVAAMIDLAYSKIAEACRPDPKGPPTEQERDEIRNKIKRLRNHVPEDREGAAIALGNWGRKAQEAIPALRKTSNDTHTLVRIWSAWALAKIDPKDTEAVRALALGFQEKEFLPRSATAEGLGELGKAALPALPALCAALKDTEEEVRYLSAFAIGEIGPNARPAVPALVDALDDPSARVRVEAAAALRIIGRDSKPAIPVLIRHLKDPDARVRGSSAGALREIGPEAIVALPALLPLLEDKDDFVRANAVCVFGNFAAAAEPVVPMLCKILLEDEVGGVSSYAADTLGRLGRHAKAAIPALEKATHSSNGGIRKSSVKALAKIRADK